MTAAELIASEVAAGMRVAIDDRLRDLDAELDRPPVNKNTDLYKLSQADESKFQELKRELMDEGLRRFKEDPQSVPDVQFWRIFNDALKIDLALQRTDKPETPAEAWDVRTLIDDSNLPLERKLEMVEGQLSSLQDQLSQLEEMKRDLQVLPELPELVRQEAG